MKGRNLVIAGLPILAVGIGLAVARQSIQAGGVVMTGAILFVFAGILNLMSFAGAKRDERRSRGAVVSLFGQITSVAAIILGLSMLIFRDTFSTLVPFMFGIIVGFMSLYQYFLLAYGCRPDRLPGWLYIVPTALAACAVYLFMQRAGETADSVIMLTTGISLGVFGLTAVVEGLMIGRQNRETAPAKDKDKDAHDSQDSEKKQASEA